MCKESLPENATTTTTTYKNSNDSGRLKRCSSISLLPRFRLNTTVKRLVWETDEPMYQTKRMFGTVQAMLQRSVWYQHKQKM